MLELFYASCSSFEDKDKRTTWSIDVQRFEMAIRIYEVTELRKAFEMLGQWCAIMNGGTGPAPVSVVNAEEDADA